MKKVVITGVRQAELVEVPDPRPVADWALVNVTIAPMCTEYKIFQAGRPNAYLGHEAAGVVQEVAQPGKVKPGDRVVVMPLYACGKCPLCLAGDYIHCEHAPDFAAFTGGTEGRATYAQYLLKPDWLLLPIPDDVSDELGSLACCGLGPTFGACQRMAVDAFDTVLITGLGPVGLGGVINARYRGARVIAVESVPYRVEKALALGAEVVLDPRDEGTLARLRELTGGRGVDKAIDCSGVVAAAGRNARRQSGRTWSRAAAPAGSSAGHRASPWPACPCRRYSSGPPPRARRGDRGARSHPPARSCGRGRYATPCWGSPRYARPAPAAAAPARTCHRLPPPPGWSPAHEPRKPHSPCRN